MNAEREKYDAQIERLEQRLYIFQRQMHLLKKNMTNKLKKLQSRKNFVDSYTIDINQYFPNTPSFYTGDSRHHKIGMGSGRQGKNVVIAPLKHKGHKVLQNYGIKATENFEKMVKTPSGGGAYDANRLS